MVGQILILSFFVHLEGILLYWEVSKVLELVCDGAIKEVH
jgi:hypothetical protein